MDIMEFIKKVMDTAVTGTLYGISLSLCILCLISIWKWFLGVVVRVVFNLFPGLENRSKGKGWPK